MENVEIPFGWNYSFQDGAIVLQIHDDQGGTFSFALTDDRVHILQKYEGRFVSLAAINKEKVKQLVNLLQTWIESNSRKE